MDRSNPHGKCGPARIRPARPLAAAALLSAVLAAAAVPAGACVGRTILVGYFDSPEQILVANILAVFIDERTGTTVKLARFAGRDEAFEAIRSDKVSLYADYSGIVLERFGGEAPGPDPGRNDARLKELLNRRHNVIWLERFGYDASFPGTSQPGRDPGPAGLMLCKDALAKFPALPKLLGKLSGALDNETVAALLREAQEKDPKAVARRFLKSRKLI